MRGDLEKTKRKKIWKCNQNSPPLRCQKRRRGGPLFYLFSWLNCFPFFLTEKVVDIECSNIEQGYRKPNILGDNGNIKKLGRFTTFFIYQTAQFFRSQIWCYCFTCPRFFNFPVFDASIYSHLFQVFSFKHEPYSLSERLEEKR